MRTTIALLGIGLAVVFVLAASPDPRSNDKWQYVGEPNLDAIPATGGTRSENGCLNHFVADYWMAICPGGNHMWRRRG